MLATAAGLVRPGGRLVYVTCSVLPQENRGSLEAFLASAPDFAVVRPGVQQQQEAVVAPVEPAPEAYDEVVVEHPSAAAPLPEAEPGFVDEDVATARVARGQSPVRVERTQWHPSPERRVAWVEVEGITALREVREGERVGPYVVREIEAAAVLFADGSVELRREVGR